MERNGENAKRSGRGTLSDSLYVTKRSLTDALYRMFDFSGRTSRRAYLIAAITYGLCIVIFLACSIWTLNWNLGAYENTVQDVFKGLYCFFLFIQGSLFVRRNHDLGDSIWDVFNPFNRSNNIPFMGKTVFDPGELTANKFGPPHILS